MHARTNRERSNNSVDRGQPASIYQCRDKSRLVLTCPAIPNTVGDVFVAVLGLPMSRRRSTGRHKGEDDSKDAVNGRPGATLTRASAAALDKSAPDAFSASCSAISGAADFGVTPIRANISLSATRSFRYQVSTFLTGMSQARSQLPRLDASTRRLEHLEARVRRVPGCGIAVPAQTNDDQVAAGAIERHLGSGVRLFVRLTASREHVIRSSEIRQECSPMRC